VIVSSYTQQIEVTIPYIITYQGNREFGSSSISTQDLLFIADIPSLDFSLTFDQFCKKTNDYINDYKTLGVKPSLWQRPADMRRIRNVADWLNSQGDNSMPDGVLIGQRNDNSVIVSAHSTIGDFEIYSIKIINNLSSSCPSHGDYLDDQGVPIYRNRCDNHNCNYHYVSTSPFSIIDGQHRTLSLFNSNLSQKQVNISVLLKRAIKSNNNNHFIGYDADDQAKIFTQVNTESEELDKIHKTWLKRFFGDWSNNQTNQKVIAYDLLAQLGQTPTVGTQNRWSPYVKFHPKSGGNARIESLRATDAGTGTIDGKSSMESIVADLDIASRQSNRQSFLIMKDFLESACQNFPDQLSLPIYNGFLDKQRPFEAFIRVFPRIKHCVEIMPNFTGNYNVSDFNNVFSQFNLVLNSSEWQLFSASGELPWLEFYNILKLMWEPDVNGILAMGPNWQTVKSPNNVTWIEYIRQTPDPLEDYSDRTKCDPTSIVIQNGPLNTAFTRQVKHPFDQVSWLRPRNVASLPKIFYRVYDVQNLPGPWLNHDSGLNANPTWSDTRDTELHLSNLNALQAKMATSQNIFWDLRIIYSNLIGETQTIINYTT
jgi:hypothetical protein